MAEQFLPFNFDPTERLIDSEGNRHIAELPHPGFLLRWYPHMSVFMSYHKGEVDVARHAIANAAAHHELLASCGIWVPDHHDFIGAMPESGGTELTIYSMVERVPNYTPLTKYDKEAVRESLRRYLDWAIWARQDLLDVFIPEQYASIPPTSDNKTVALLDIEPRFVPNNAYFQAQARANIDEF